MLWCYKGDAGGWSHKLVTAAFEAGMNSGEFQSPVVPEPGDYVFMRIPQWEPECSEGKTIAETLHRRGCKLIPDIETILMYEDKYLQTIAYSKWMPETYLIRHDGWELARKAMGTLGYPFISKSSLASASANVRLIHNEAEAQQEWDLSIQGDGIPMKIGKGRVGKQLGYLIWQKLCEGNSCDYRVCRVGNYYMMLQRDNKPGTVFASGSGVNRPVNHPDQHESNALEKAKEFFEAEEIPFGGIDLVYDREEKDWKILETTLGWSQDAYHDCVFFGSPYRGHQMFDLIVSEIRNGAFG